jgi:tetratricopeptide (TPR) repeat protein
VNRIVRWLPRWLLAPLRQRQTARLVAAAGANDWTQVLDTLDRARTLRPLDPLELGYLGAAYLRLDRFEDIVAEFSALEACVPRDGAAIEALRPYLAAALLCLERNFEALEQLEAMRGPDVSPAHEALRHWNHAVALYRVGRAHEARDLLMKQLDGHWPRPEYDHALDLLRSLGVEAH